MNERDALLQELGNARNLLTQIQQNLQNLDALNGQKQGIARQIVQVQHSKPVYDRTLRLARRGSLYGALLGIAVALIPVIGKFIGIAVFLGGCLMEVRSRPMMEEADKRHREQQQRQIAALQDRFPGLDQQIAVINQQNITPLARAYNANCPHFPLDQWDLSSIGKVYEFVSSGRANTLKEALDEFDLWQHRQTMEEMQRKQVWNQRMSNILSAAGIAAQARTTAAVNRNTDAVNEQTAFLGDALANGPTVAAQNWNARHS
ncbi:hypothetical protein [Bifidobacterium parmae]|uniref:Uncharacterized protein n=1 Tax=Bifidobacterium parmae TaxID=361854 RepID=A0A2N5J645_9BIFI|nr:hypothetical protein [Bifidobacterium parmae]PLS29689.1 hypothetical protein Uis4E_0030 [Bifidobacterium parmae]